MMLVWALIALTVVGLSWNAAAQQGPVLSGVISATDSEAAEGYFAVGQELTVVAKPGTPLHTWLTSHKDERAVLTLDTQSSH